MHTSHNSPNASRRASLDTKSSLVKRYSFIKKDHLDEIDCYYGPYNLDCVFNM